jgi:hypothetical protein
MPSGLTGKYEQDVISPLRLDQLGQGQYFSIEHLAGWAAMLDSLWQTRGSMTRCPRYAFDPA